MLPTVTPLKHVTKSLLSDGCFSGSTILALNRHDTIRKTLIIPLSYGENHTLLAVFVFSIRVFKMCALILGHSVFMG